MSGLCCSINARMAPHRAAREPTFQVMTEVRLLVARLAAFGRPLASLAVGAGASEGEFGPRRLATTPSLV